jgi:hypothetical protein
MSQPPDKEAVLSDNPDFEPYGRGLILDECCIFAHAGKRDHTLIHSDIIPWYIELD